MMIAGHITPIALGFWDTPPAHRTERRTVAKIHPAPATFPPQQGGQFHGVYNIGAH
ncbi:hypothetical protein OAB00_01640 [Akkermansiaceae bacterium]|nr:hypothetical protein [Akkermansiaceae bacterium]